MKKVINPIFRFIKMLNSDNIFVYAAQASFFIIISAIPLSMLFLSLLRYLLPVSGEEILLLSRNVFPEFLLPITQAILKEVLEKASLPLISATALSALWTASRGVLAIERGVRNVFGLTASRNFIKNAAFGMAYTIIFILIMAVILVFFAFGAAIIRFSATDSGVIFTLFERRSPLKWGLAILVLSFIFSLIYTAFSERKIKFLSQAPGAFFTTSGWLIFSVLYSFYIDSFANYSYVYGSLTAVILMMLWIYFCMIIFLTGAEVNKVIFRRKKRAAVKNHGS